MSGSATIGNIDIGMRADVGKLQKDFKTAQTIVQAFTVNVASQAKSIGTQASVAASPLASLGSTIKAIGIGVAAYKFGGFFIEGIKGASDLNETLSKTDVILGESAGPVKAFADQMAKDFGLVKRETLDAASSFGGLAQSVGKLKGQDLSDFSIKMTKLAADLQSQKNIGSLDESSKILQIGLRGGQSDELNGLGVILNETTLKQYALAHGIQQVNGAFSEQQKFEIRSAMITEGLNKASGDLERTADSTSNQIRKFTGNVTNLGTSLGQFFLPIVTAVTTKLNGLLSGLTESLDSNKERINSGFATIGAGINAALRDIAYPAISLVGEAFGTLSGIVSSAVEFMSPAISTVGNVITNAYDVSTFALRNLGAIFQATAIQANESLTNLFIRVQTFAKNVQIAVGFIARNWYEILTDGFNASKAYLLNFFTNIESLVKAGLEAIKGNGFNFEWKGLTDGFQSAVKELPMFLQPELINLQGDIDKVFEGIGQKELKRTLQIQQDAKKVASPIATPGKPNEAPAETTPAAEKKFASVATLGSKEALSSIAKSQLGRGDNSIKDVAQSSKANLEVNRQILSETKKKTAGTGAAPFKFAT